MSEFVKQIVGASVNPTGWGSLGSSWGSLNLDPQPFAQPVPITGGFQMPTGGITGAVAEPGITQAVQNLQNPAPTSWWEDSGFLGKTLADGTKVNGWGGAALGVGQAALGAFMGMKQLKIAKEQLAEGKRQFDMNYGAQRQTTNTALEDRQRARVASNEGAYESVGSYMARNGIR